MRLDCGSRSDLRYVGSLRHISMYVRFLCSASLQAPFDAIWNIVAGQKSEHTDVLHGCVCAHDSLCDVYHVQTFSLRTFAVEVLKAIHAKRRAVIKWVNVHESVLPHSCMLKHTSPSHLIMPLECPEHSKLDFCWKQQWLQWGKIPSAVNVHGARVWQWRCTANAYIYREREAEGQNEKLPNV